MGYSSWGRKESDMTERLTLPLLLLTNSFAPSSQFFILNFVETTVWFLSLDWTVTDIATSLSLFNSEVLRNCVTQRF